MFFRSAAAVPILMLSATVLYAQSNHNGSDDARQRAAILFEKGQTEQAHGNLNNAVRRYTEAISSDPGLYQAYYQRALALMSLGEVDEAQTDLRQVVKLGPDFARGHRALGQLYLDRGLTPDAIQELETALKLEPQLTGVRLYYASALIKTGKPAAAIDQLHTANTQGEASSLTYALLGVAEERTGKTSEAFADYSQAIQMNANEATAREGRARLLEARGDFQKAIEDCAIAYRSQPSPDIGIKLAQLHLHAGQPDSAILIYRALLNERPNDLTLRADMLRIMADNGHLPEAEQQIKGLIQTQPGNTRILILAGDIYFKAQPELSADYYRQAVEQDPTDNTSRVQLGASLVRSKKFEQALPVLSEAISHDRSNVQAHTNIATALFELKQYPQAASEFAWLVQKRPGVPVAFYFLAISLDKMGDCLQSLRAYQEFIERADPAANKKEIDDASIRVSLLQKLVKQGKCKPPRKGKGK
jgi:tetratricopeptide (TPR) repeat protein